MFVFYIVLALLCGAYFVALSLFSPTTFLGTIAGFSMGWILLAAFFVFLALARKFNLREKISETKKNIFYSGLGFLGIIFAITLLFICHPKLLKDNLQDDKNLNRENPKYAILLGGGITKDAELSENVKRRAKKAADFLKQNPETIIVVSGGQGKFAPCPESNVLKPYLASLGIDEKRILEEDKAKDTIQNLIFSAEVLAEHENVSVEKILDSQIVIISSFPHIARAQQIAKRLGYKETFGLASKTPAIFVPHSYLRESCAQIKLALRILFTGKPRPIISKTAN